MSGEDYETDNQKKAVCPYCGAEQDYMEECRLDIGETECGECGEIFRYVREIEVTYTTSKRED